jgi:Fe-S cluster assembly iron-binding protein IscA
MSPRRQTAATAKRKIAPRKGKEKTAQKPYRPTIDASMNVLEIISLHPSLEQVLAAYGLHCFQCAFNAVDSLDAGARAHGLTDVDIENIVIDLEEAIAMITPKPQHLTLTPDAARALAAIAKERKQSAIALRIEGNAQEGFCMEFTNKAHAGDLSFQADDIEGVTLSASPAILWHIGGASVDVRDGRFTLDLPPASCACTGESCACKAQKS